jgi:glycosyltransferase involved in cell wall biosynthesis
MRKFLFIAANEWPNWGGSELLWASAAEKLVRRGMEVRVSVPDFGRPISQVERLRSAGCRISHRRRPSLLSRLARKVLPIPESALRHVRSIASGVDLVVISQGGNLDGLLWMEHARAAHYKYAVIAQGAAEFSWPDDDLARRLAAGYEGASRSYFVSQATLNLSRRQFGTPLLGGKVIRNPFNVRYEAQPSWPTSGTERLSLACVGRLEVITKGQDLLLEVMGLPHWRQRNVQISLIGKGVNERVLRQRAEQLKLTSIEFSGYSNDIEEVWSKHHALVLPSRQEGMPLTLVEAMLCARSVIVTDVGGNRELVQDGINGFLAKAPTVELLDEAIGRAWESRSRLREMGERAASDVRKWVSKDPSEEFAQELESLLDGNNNHSRETTVHHGSDYRL